MPKTESKNDKSAAASAKEVPTAKRKSATGLDEIDDLFATKKTRQKQEKHKEQEQKAAAKKRKREEQHQSTSSTRGNKSVLEEKFSSSSTTFKRQWVDDGLGGKFNQEGYTGRVEDGVKVFKAHVLNKPGFGRSSDCPFDCDCCFI